MSDYAVLGDLLVIYTVSTVVVFVFHQFRLPSIAGFLVAGALIGPHGLHLIPDVSQVQVLAEIGIVLLLFTIGMEFSSAHFAAARRIFMVAAPVQTGGVLILAMGGALLVGLSYQQGIFWGFLLSLSSTAIVLKALSEQGESDSFHGRATVAILIFQDLAVVPMMLVTPILGTPTGSAMGTVLMTLFKAAMVVGLDCRGGLVPGAALAAAYRTQPKSRAVSALYYRPLPRHCLADLAGRTVAGSRRIYRRSRHF